MVQLSEKQHLDIALKEYDVKEVGDVVKEIGIVTQIYDNEHGAGEQVYVVVR